MFSEYSENSMSLIWSLTTSSSSKGTVTLCLERNVRSNGFMNLLPYSCWDGNHSTIVKKFL